MMPLLPRHGHSASDGDHHPDPDLEPDLGLEPAAGNLTMANASHAIAAAASVSFPGTPLQDIPRTFRHGAAIRSASALPSSLPLQCLSAARHGQLYERLNFSVDKKNTRLYISIQDSASTVGAAQVTFDREEEFDNEGNDFFGCGSGTDDALQGGSQPGFRCTGAQGQAADR
ncbi:hypothetical protein [Rhizobium sp. SL42]|uniref:hypothetical protein n=1 Tax=Rhizobium sp. SL42 TaxID=2806346 RepID=UPI001F3B7DD9|nr:hypothetical protein [Rhizobium sp. SL42]UJW75969.1 hypothetical protein IM739_05590 [Rhizobium sp. SL42]